MKAITAFGVVVALAAAPAFAAPKKMSDTQMDNVTGGALVNAILVDVVDVNNNNVQVAVPVNAAVAAGILGNAGAVSVQRPGRQVIP